MEGEIDDRHIQVLQQSFCDCSQADANEKLMRWAKKV